MSSNGGNAQSQARAAALAKGQAEAAAQAQREAQQKQQSLAAGQKATGTPQSHGFDSAGNRLNDQGKIVQFASRQAQESFLSARGVGNTGQIINPDLYAKADFTSIAGITAAQQQASSISPTFKPEENYGYTSKVSPIVSQNFDKDPLESNWELSKSKPATQARASFRSQFSSDQGGIITPQSQGKSFGYSWASKQTQSEAEKLFSGQTQLKRGSTQEQAIQNSEAARALAGTKSTSNKDYLSGGTKQPDYNAVVTLEKAQKVFGKTVTSFYGWTDISKDQLVRGSAREKQVAQNQADMFGSKNAKGGINKSISLTESLGISDIISGAKSQAQSGSGADLITNYRGIQSLADKGALISFSDQSGKPLGFASGKNAGYDYLKISEGGRKSVNYSVLYPQTEKALLSSINQNPAFFEKQVQQNPHYFDQFFASGKLQPSDVTIINSIFAGYNREQNAQVKADQKSFAYSLTRQEKPGVSFQIIDNNGKILGVTSGQRARYDILKAQGFGSKGKEVGSYNQNIGYKTKDSFSIAQSLKYSTDLPVKPETYSNTKSGAIGGVLGLLSPITASQNKIIQEELVGVAKGGLTALGSIAAPIASFLEPKTILLGNKTTNENAFYNLKYIATGGIKPVPVLQPFISFYQKNEVKGNPIKTLTNILSSNVPPSSVARTFWNDIKIEPKEPMKLSETGQSIEKATTFPSAVQANLGRQNATESYGYYVGGMVFGSAMIGLTAGGAITGAIGAKGAILRPNGMFFEGKTMARMPSGEGFVEVPTTIKVTGRTIGEGRYAIGVGMKSSEGTKIPFLSTLRPNTPYMKSILSKFESNSELGQEAGSLTNLFASKVYTKTGANVLSDLGVITKEQQTDLINLSYNMAKSGEFNKIPQSQVSKPVFSSLTEKLNLTGNKEVNANMINVLGSEQAKPTSGIKKIINRGTAFLSKEEQLKSGPIVPSAGGSLSNVIPINAFNKEISIESAKQYSGFFSSSEQKFPYFKPEQSPIPVREVSTIGDIDILLNRNTKNVKRGFESGRVTFGSKEEFEKQKAEDVLQSNKILDLLQTNVKAPEGFGFAKSGKTNIAFGKVTEYTPEGKPSKVEGETVLNLLGIRDEINLSGAAGESSKFTFGRWFNTYPQSKTIRQGDVLTTNTINYQAWAKGKSVMSYQSRSTIENFPSAITKEQKAATEARFKGMKNIVNPANKRLKDVADLYSIARYAERTTTGKTSKSFGQLATNLETHFTNADWSVLTNKDVKITPELKLSFQQQYKSLNPHSKLSSPSKSSVSSGLSSISATSKASPLSPSSSSALSSKSSTSSIRSPSSSSALSSKSSTSSFRSSKSSSSALSKLSSSFRSPSSRSGSTKSSQISKYTSPSFTSKSSKSSFTSSGSPTSPSPSSPSSTSSIFSPTSPLTPSSTSSIFNPQTVSTIFNTKTSKIPLIKFGNIGIRRKSRLFEGPTGLRLLNVTNVFASDLNIRVPKNKRFEF